MNLVINYDINENHIDGKYGLTEKIKQSMYNVTKEFVYIGFLLSEADEFEYYKEKGYSSIHEYASIELGFKKSSTYNFINVFRKFCKFQNGHTTMFPVDYQDFKFSQLVEMLSMNDKQIKAVTPDMSVREIRELKKKDIVEVSFVSNYTSFQASGMNKLGLKACPFCGSTEIVFDKFEIDTVLTEFSVFCTNCRASTYDFGTEEEAKLSWNARI